MQSYIKAFTVLRFLGPLAIFFIATTFPARAQLLIFDARVSHTNTLINTPILYSLDFTNNSGLVQNVVITNRFSAPIVLTDFGTNLFNTVISVESNQIVAVAQVPLGQGGFVDLQVTSTNATVLTNFVTFSLPATNFPGVQLVTTFTNAPIVISDLAVTVTAPSAPVLVNDQFSYFVTVTNRSGTAATGVQLTNTLPAGITFRNTSAANQPIINVGDLAANAGRRFQLFVRATSAGSKTVSAAAGMSGGSDTNAANNAASATFTVDALVTGQLIATNASDMVLNFQNALMEQTVRLVNISSSNAASARLIINNLQHPLRNAAGTNSGTPFVAYAAPLAPGEGVNLVLQYFVPARVAFDVPNDSYVAVATSTYNVNVPVPSAVTITNIVQLPSQDVMIEFPATPGRTYTIYYSSAMDFPDARAAIPPIVAQTSKVQWIDDGPPKTISAVNSTTNRFYRVLLNP
ncbi:MAG TPA: DUF11 domain-containing protein [Verrucomicrobiae bacterium]|nr:DUF11 domain-containing protein [Verrucomicrobiae bacterium]